MRILIIIIILLCLTSITSKGAQQIITRKISLGGKLASGNTNSNAVYADFSLSRDRKWIDETTFAGSFDQQSVDNQNTMYKWSMSARHAVSFQKINYGFLRVVLDHDRFKDIELRTVPTLGFGHWFSDADDLKLMAEIAAGYQKETLLNNTAQDSLLLQLRGYSKARVFDDETLSQDFYAYIDAGDMNSFRLLSTSTFKSPLNKYLSLKLVLKDEFTNRPPAGVRKNDLLFTLGFEYSVKEKTKL